MQSTIPPARQYGLDWLRVIAFGLLIFYHTGMFFVTWEFHLKNADTSLSMELWMLFLNQWRLPLLFFVSGAGVAFALRRRTAGQFVRERCRRLLVPVVFGMLVVVPPQIYFERLHRRQFSGSYWDFYPSVFQFEVYPEGSFSWHHLWFVVYLLVYSLLVLPVARWLRGPGGQRAADRLAAFAAGRPTALWLPVLPVWAAFVGLSPWYPVTHGLLNDWFNHALSFFIFLCGLLLGWQPALLASVVRVRRAALAGGVVCFGLMLLFFSLPNRDFIDWLPKIGDFEAYTLPFFIYYTLKSLNIWFWLLALTGYAVRHLDFSTPFLRRANEAVYPFYILHQTIMIGIGYYVIQWQAGVVAKFWVIALATFAATTLVYLLLVRPFGIVRWLFGMKPAVRR